MTSPVLQVVFFYALPPHQSVAGTIYIIILILSSMLHVYRECALGALILKGSVCLCLNFFSKLQKLHIAAS